ncbi:MAG: hypothetical protein QNJ29_00960 [Rhizobiaceae bacterium]|nr:hypothetical protein [Rhizobiaceae bacterium]
MDRRHFLKSIGATALIPAIPAPAGALAQSAPVAVAPAFSAHTYQWAEMIVRAHNKCNLGLLQRSLRIDATAATALKETLIKNGIVAAQANAYGIHTATKPLYEGAFMSVSDVVEKTTDVAEKISELLEPEDQGSDTEFERNEPDISNIDEELESETDLEIRPCA